MANEIVTKLKLENEELRRNLTDSESRISAFTDRVGVTMSRLAAGIAAAFTLHAIRGHIDEAIAQWKDAEDAAAKYEAVLTATGREGRLTSEALKDLAAQLQLTTRVGDDATVAAASLLGVYETMGEDTMPKVLTLAADMAALFDGDVRTSAMMLGRALDDPARGMLLLRRYGINLSEDTRTLIKDLAEMGDVAGAQAVILGQLEARFSGLADAMGETLAGRLEQRKNQIGDLYEEIGEKLAPTLIELIDLSDALGTAFGVWLGEVDADFGELNATLSETEKTLIGIQTMLLNPQKAGAGMVANILEAFSTAGMSGGAQRSPRERSLQQLGEVEQDIQWWEQKRREAQRRLDEPGMMESAQGRRVGQANVARFEREIAELVERRDRLAKELEAPPEQTFMEMWVEELRNIEGELAGKYNEALDAVEQRREDADRRRQENRKRRNDAAVQREVDELKSQEKAQMLARLKPTIEAAKAAEEAEREREKVFRDFEAKRGKRWWEPDRIERADPTKDKDRGDDSFLARIERAGELHSRITAAAASRADRPEDKIVRKLEDEGVKRAEEMEKLRKTMEPLPGKLDELPRAMAREIGTEVGLA